MSHLNPGLISAYNSLTDKHLAGYFSNTRIRRHLHRAGLITRSGRIVPDKEYRQKLIQRAHQRHVRECLAQAIFHKVLEMERLHQIEIKRKLEEFARRERVHKIKVERSKRYEEDIIRILSPHPPTGARGFRKQHSGPEGEHTESSESPGSSRPNTAPGKMQRPVRLKPLHSNSTTASHRHSSPYRRQHPPHHNQRPFNGTVDKDSDRRLNTMEVRNGISPYCLPVINNFVTPVPPSTRRKERSVKLSTSGTVRGRRLRPTTSSSAADGYEDPPSMLRSSVPQSRVCVNMVYLGKTVHLSNDLHDLRDEVKVFQQHCGGENLCVYKGKLREGESFQFISRRHRGFPFSLTFFLNGLQVERLSSCCEFKHRKSSRLGGRHGHFAFSGVDAASPCYKCIIAMGLDKKPIPPPKRMKEEAVKMGIVPTLKVTDGDAETTKGECAASRSESESSPRKDTEMTAKEDSKVKDDYEEDFEADDEGPTEEEKKCTSPNGVKEEKGKETEGLDSEDSEKEDDIKSRSRSSFSGSNREESDAEEVKEANMEDKEEQVEEAQEEVQEEAPLVEAEAAPSSEADPAGAKDCEIQDSAGQSTEIEIGDNSGSSGNENRAASDTRTTTEGERRTDESTQGEPERAKSVQEKLAEAILKESHCSSEPELSDTSTETEASSNKSAEKEAKVAEAVAETSTGKVEVIEEEKKLQVPVVQEVKAEVHTSQEQEEIAEENVVQNDRVSDEAVSEVAKDADTEEKETSEEDATTSTLQDKPKDEIKDLEATEPEAKSVQKEDESAASDVSNKPDESVNADNTEPLTVTETMRMKAEAADTQEAIGNEEAPATDTKANDTQQEAEELIREEGEVKTKELTGDDAKEESVLENGETKNIEGETVDQEDVDEHSGLNEEQKDEVQKENVEEDISENNTKEEEAEVAGINLSPDEQDKDDLDKNGKETEVEEESKPDGEVKNEENLARVVDSSLNTAQTEDDAVKTPSEKEVSEEPTEEQSKTGQDGSPKEDTSEAKSDYEDVKNAVKDEVEVEQTESKAQNHAVEHVDVVGELANPESTSQKEEGLETNPEKNEDSAKLTEENVKSDYAASVAGEAPKATEIKPQEVGESEIENDSSKEVDAENGEVSVVAETKQIAENDESENTIDEPQSVINTGENRKLEDTNETEKSELKQENGNSGPDINDEASVHSKHDLEKPISKDLDPIENNNNMETAQTNADKPKTGQGDAVEGSGVEGENGDTEDASKASEEGDSVLLKPQVKSSLSEHVNEMEPKGSPEGLTTADSADLVTNWVTVHQTSKYFETFVEPLEEIREVSSEASHEQSSSELQRSESPVKMLKGGGNTKDEQSDVGSKSEAKQDGSTKETVQAEESLVLRVPTVENDQNLNESAMEESERSKEAQTDPSAEGEKTADSSVPLHNNVTRTSITSSHLSITSGKQTVSEILNAEKGSDHGQDATKTEDTKIEELPETLGDLNPVEHTAREDAQESSENREVTARPEFTVSKSDSIRGQESTMENSLSGETRELIEGSSHTVSKEHLSSFSVDNTVFGQRTLLTASKAENGH